ncbi:hypothetical protein C7974DRAFT_50891 [Boeremia exigua]|uniref:uncharacterized protein n=1 Tax=Boeremia exigua TaxID=749465 RepID=UPI001E8E3937|nr:uncharacterized protein C7974DRAFT_50891 [Boeremia exigua]KAH6616719.1 hypothetical protein C7974DRAFT_50891 [Boeremia exigua]
MSNNEPSPNQRGRGGPPYAPTNAGLGGSPDVIPDIPIAAVFLVLYLVFGIIHIKILKSNKGRGHKFIFNGAILGLCKIRVVAMSLRIAWACNQRNVGLALAANVFVYVGTIIVYMVNWFFTQRVVRAQHTKLGWSMPYRIFHRGALGLLIISLLMLVVPSIWQSFTLNANTHRIFRNLQLAGQTYFTVLAFAPIVLVLISLIIPRHEIDKFGAGRLRVNIIILLIAAGVISIGQIFRCVITWLPPVPIRNARGQYQEPPWYYSKGCFYAFNFVTEIIVIIIYAVVRVDLRFHVPDGAKRAGDYSRSSVNVHISNQDLHANRLSIHSNGSNETLHSYQTSMFEDSGTLADSLRYPSTTLAIDEKTGAWKVKRASGSTTSSKRSSDGSRSSMWLDRNTMIENNIPPVPEIPSRLSWPLRTSMLHPNDSVAKLEHSNHSSKHTSPTSPYELKNHTFNDHDVGDAVQAALNILEGKPQSTTKTRSRSPPPGYDNIAAASRSSTEKKYKHFSRPRSDVPHTTPSREKTRKHASHPAVITKDGRKVLRKQKSASAEKSSSPSLTTPSPSHSPTPQTHYSGPSSMPEPTAALSSHPPKHPRHARTPSLEVIALAPRDRAGSPRVLDLSSVPLLSGCESRPESPHAGADGDGYEMRGARSGGAGAQSMDSSTASEAVRAEDEFRRFSFEAGGRCGGGWGAGAEAGCVRRGVVSFVISMYILFRFSGRGAICTHDMVVLYDLWFGLLLPHSFGSFIDGVCSFFLLTPLP